MPSDQALQLMGELLTTDRAQVAVASVDWGALKPAYEARRARPFLALVGPREAPRPQPKADTRSDLLRRIEGARAHERRDVVVAFLRGEVGRALGIQALHTIDTGQGLFEMGMDSLMSVELKGRIESAVGTGLPSTLTFNYPTIDALADFLTGEVLAAPEAAEAAGAPQDDGALEAAAPSELDDLSEDDLAALLAAKLSTLQ
jgi:acyl carrier protein